MRIFPPAAVALHLPRLWSPADPKPTYLPPNTTPLLSFCGESGKERGRSPTTPRDDLQLISQDWRWISWRTSPRRLSRWQIHRHAHTRMGRMGTLHRRGLSAPSALKASMCQPRFKAISRKGTVKKVTSTDLQARGIFIHGSFMWKHKCNQNLNCIISISSINTCW